MTFVLESVAKDMVPSQALIVELSTSFFLYEVFHDKHSRLHCSTI